MGLVVLEVGHAEPAKPTRPLANHHEVLERVHSLDEHRVAVGKPIDPVGRPGIVLRCLHDPEVGGRIVGEDQEESVGVVYAVFDVGPAGRDHPGLTGGTGSGNDSPLGRGKAVGRDEDVLPAPRPLHADIVEDVVLLKHLDVLLPRRADHMPPDGVPALGGIGGHIEERLIVVRPRRPVPDVGDLVDDLTGLEILDVERVFPEGGEIFEVQQGLTIGADIDAAQRVELLPLRQGVLVEVHFLRRR